MEIRKANRSDINELTHLRIKFLEEIHGEKSEEDKRLLKESLTKHFESKLNEKLEFFLAIKDNKIIGTSGILFYEVPPTYANISGLNGYVMNVYTLKEFRGRGVARKLVERCLIEAKERNCTTVHLRATEMGQPLYESFGFINVDNEMMIRL